MDIEYAAKLLRCEGDELISQLCLRKFHTSQESGGGSTTTLTFLSLSLQTWQGQTHHFHQQEE